MCFHWKSLRRQVRAIGKVEKYQLRKQIIIFIQDHIKIGLAHGPHHNRKY